MHSPNTTSTSTEGLLPGCAHETMLNARVCRGLRAVHDAASGADKETLVKDLVAILSGGQRATRASMRENMAAAGDAGDADDDEDDQNYTSSLPSGGNIATYQELCCMALSIEKPGLVYALMDLASASAAMAGKRGSAKGKADEMQQAKMLLQPHVGEIFPKLYRHRYRTLVCIVECVRLSVCSDVIACGAGCGFGSTYDTCVDVGSLLRCLNPSGRAQCPRAIVCRYDPDKHLREAMGRILVALVPEQQKALNEYFDDVVETLLEDMTSSHWRDRQSACNAIADVLQARSLTLLYVGHFAASSAPLPLCLPF